MTFPETVQVPHTSSGPGNRRHGFALGRAFAFGARMGTLQLLQPGGGRQSGASMPRRMIRTPIRTGFCRPPRSRSRDRRRGGLRGRGWWRRRWCVREGRTAHARRRGRGLLAPPAPSGRNPRAAAPPGAARSRPRPDPRRQGGACFLGPRPRARSREGTFLALPAPLRPFPLLPRRVFSAPVKIVPHK